MKRKRIYIFITAILAVSTTFQSFAAGWQQIGETWSWIDELENKVTLSWLQDTDGNWYYLDATGAMVTGWLENEGEFYYLTDKTGGPKGSLRSGWHYLDDGWYFFNTIHDGTFGKTLTGWHWIDGYCYYFGSKAERGRMNENTTTPDGYTVGATGAWMENGSYVYRPGKGILTKAVSQSGSVSATTKSSGSGSGSGGGGSGSSSVTTVTYTYTIRCLDLESGNVIAIFSGTGKSGSKVTPNYTVDGYTINSLNTFALAKDKQVFDVYYTAILQDEVYSYEIRCIDQADGRVLEIHIGEGKKGGILIPDYEIEGYVISGSQSFTLEENEQVLLVPYDKLYPYTIYLMDIGTGNEIGILSLFGVSGEERVLEHIKLEGYELLGNPPLSITISTVEENNYLYLYYKEISTYETEAKEVTFRVEFVDASDHDYHVLNDVIGTGTAGESIPVYFTEQFNDQEGNVWQAVGLSPRLFLLEENSGQIFTIEYVKKETIPTKEIKQYTYSIRYLSQDTGAILGITTGYAAAGTKIAYRNTFTDYGLAGNENTFTVTDDERQNTVFVPMKRTMFPGPSANELTGEYEGCNWLILFTDEEGEPLLPEVRGFTVSGSPLVVDYPDVIEGEDGMFRRAEIGSPYYEVLMGTSYRQIIIKYMKGDASENKLLMWQREAQKAKLTFYESVPYSYFLLYQEKNSWNDIALYIGTGTMNSYATIPALDIDGYITPTERLGGFTLEKDGILKTALYQRAKSGTSYGYAKTAYTIRFEDKDGNNIFESYSGHMAAEGLEEVMSLPVYYPNTFKDIEGNIWEADIKSPQVFLIDTLSLTGNVNTIVYKKVFENPMTDLVVTNETEALIILEAFAASLDDANPRSFYIIGKGYSPKDIAAGSIINAYNLSNYTNTIVDTYEIDGTVYTVCQVSFERKWESDGCSHKWETVQSVNGGCLVTGSETIACKKCKEEYTLVVPALGHMDDNKDSMCDSCGRRAFSQYLGDEFIASFDSKGEFPLFEYKFICIDDDYQGSGKMLYICEDDITSDVYGVYSHNNQADFYSSALYYFLNDTYLDGLGNLRDATNPLTKGNVNILTLKDYNVYKGNAENNYYFPDGTFLTSTLSEDGERIVLTNGTEISVQEAENYPVRPVILLDKPETEQPQAMTWKLGDIQKRTIGGETYLFRCVSENYKDKTGTSKELALFLCEGIIPADIVNNPVTEGIETLFFGDSNNYKYSVVNRWLNENASDSLFRLATVNVGVDSSYSGSTQIYGYSQLNNSLLTRYPYDTTQYMEGKLFILSVEEALELKGYLWKFLSDAENPESQINGYCNAYWLRTPEHGSTDRVYTVNLQNGTIEAKNVNAVEGSTYSNTGIRPAFAMPQQ